MRVLVTGGTGFIGRAVLRALVARGDEVTALTRKIPGRVAEGTEAVAFRLWDPDNDGEWQLALDGQDGVVHLAGEPAVGRRLTASAREQILKSRVESTERIVRAIRMARRRPRVLVCASGVGYYGSKTGDSTVTEDSPAGDDFLAQVCVAWEKAAREAEAFGTRVVSARFGFVLGRGGGALEKLLPFFKAFVGGHLGNGRQFQPWVHLGDVTGAILKALDDATLTGPINVCSTQPVTNDEMSKTLGKVLGRPALLPAPAFALRALYGDGATPILTGHRAVPKRLLEHGYEFQFTELEPALRDLLEKA
jgi:uncharacterized protein (TIGR01777 family)